MALIFDTSLDINGKPVKPVEVDQSFNPTSTNAQSGVAVKEAVDQAIEGIYKPAGSLLFANLPTPSADILGFVYNITDAFTTDARFVEGAGTECAAGTNVVVVNTGTSENPVYKFDILAAGAVQVQSDWAQSDASAVDYIKNKPTIPTVNDATLTISQNGVLKGTFSANSSTNVAINLDGGSSYTAGTGIDITSNTISVTSPVLTNTATGTNSLTVLGTSASNNYSVNIGNGSQISQDYGVAIGADARSTSTGGVAIGYKTRAYTNSIALGYGTRAFGIKSISIGGSILNGTADNTIVLGSSNSAIGDSNKFFVANGANLYELLDLTTGKIPDVRLSTNVQTTSNLVTSVSSSSTDSQYPSAKLLYDTVGNIEATLDAIIAQGSNS